MKTSTFERALAQNANMTPLRGESLGASIKSNPHCHCYHDLKGTVKRNPHCMVHGTAKGHHIMQNGSTVLVNNNDHTHHFMNGSLSGTREWMGGMIPLGLAVGALYMFDRRKPGKLPVDLASMNPAYLVGGLLVAGYAFGGVTAAL